MWLAAISSINFSFLLHNFPNSRFILTVDVSSLMLSAVYVIFFSLFGHELSPLHWKEALYGFSLAYVICQHHYSYALGPLLSHIECVYVSVKHYDIPTVDLMSQTVTKWLIGWIHWTKGWFTSWLGWLKISSHCREWSET